MKTVIIYDQCGDSALRFYVHNGDCTELDGYYVDGEDEDEAKYEKLMSIVNNNTKHDRFPIDIVKEGDAAVIVCGFLP